jgi:hypothetical protein
MVLSLLSGSKSPAHPNTAGGEVARWNYRSLWVLKCQDGITSIANSENFQAQVF